MAGIRMAPGYVHIKPRILHINDTQPYSFEFQTGIERVGNPLTGRIENEEYLYSEEVNEVFYLDNPQGQEFKFDFHVFNEKGELPVNLDARIMFKPIDSIDSTLVQHISGTYQPGTSVESNNMGDKHGFFIVKITASLVYNKPYKEVYPMAVISDD